MQVENDYARNVRIIENIVCALKNSDSISTRTEYVESLDYMFNRYRVEKALADCPDTRCSDGADQ